MRVLSRCVPNSGRLQELALGAPECWARIHPLFARFNLRAAFAARLTAPAVNPKVFVACDAAGCSSDSRVGDDLVAGIIRNIGEQEFSSGGQQAREFGNTERSHNAERMDSASKTDLGFKDVSNTRQQRL